MKMQAIETTINAAESFERQLNQFKSLHHSQCLFKRNPLVKNLKFRFKKNGNLCGQFVCTEEHQGYDDMVHGGIIAAIIDASMTQCLMGHGIAAYTVNLSITYLEPISIGIQTILETRITASRRSMIYNLECEIRQNRWLKVQANSRFFKVRKPDSFHHAR